MLKILWLKVNNYTIMLIFQLEKNSTINKEMTGVGRLLKVQNIKNYEIIWKKKFHVCSLNRQCTKISCILHAGTIFRYFLQLSLPNLQWLFRLWRSGCSPLLAACCRGSTNPICTTNLSLNCLPASFLLLFTGSARGDTELSPSVGGT